MSSPFVSTPFVSTLDTRTSTIALALLLTDGFSGDLELVGNVAIVPAPGLQQPDKYVYFSLPPGANTLAISSDEQPPLYQPLSIKVNMPPPNPNAPFVTATLIPTVSCPFPPTATVIRGYVLSNNVPVTGVVVSAPGAVFNYTTAASGEYVLFFASITGLSQSITITATPPGGAAKSVAVQVQRGATVSQPINL